MATLAEKDTSASGGKDGKTMDYKAKLSEILPRLNGDACKIAYRLLQEVQGFLEIFEKEPNGDGSSDETRCTLER